MIGGAAARSALAAEESPRGDTGESQRKRARMVAPESHRGTEPAW